VFRNDIDDHIDLVNFGPINAWCIPNFYQYQNIANARIEGVELESNYDAGGWFAGVNYAHIRGWNVATGQTLLTIPSDVVTSTLGLRSDDRKFTIMARWAAVGARSDVPPGGIVVATKSYNLINFYMSYAPTPDVVASFGIDNVLNENYIRYLDLLPSQGITFKAGLKIRYGA